MEFNQVKWGISRQSITLEEIRWGMKEYNRQTSFRRIIEDRERYGHAYRMEERKMKQNLEVKVEAK